MIYSPKPARRGYVYLMRHDEVRTLRVIIRLKNTMIDRRIFTQPDKRNNKQYWGWLRFSRPLPLWESMEAWLVPLFNMYKAET